MTNNLADLLLLRKNVSEWAQAYETSNKIPKSVFALNEMYNR